MPRLVHKVTGVTVEVSEEFAAATAGMWNKPPPAEKPKLAARK